MITDLNETRQQLLSAALPHVDFDGWAETVFEMAIADSGVESGAARLACPRGILDLARYFHDRGDAELLTLMQALDHTEMRYRDRVARAIWERLMIADRHKEAARRAAALFSLPIHAGEATRATWATADTIWTALGDNSRDYNWYTKRMTLSAVWSACLLYWLGDESEGYADTREFIDRRIENIMQFERFKAKARENRLVKAFLDGPGRVLDRINAPGTQSDLPGSINR